MAQQSEDSWKGVGFPQEDTKALDLIETLLDYIAKLLPRSKVRTCRTLSLKAARYQQIKKATERRTRKNRKQGRMLWEWQVSHKHFSVMYAIQKKPRQKRRKMVQNTQQQELLLKATISV